MIRRLVLWTAKPRVQTAFNGAMTLVWLAMLPITLLFPLFRSSILWLAFISAWALFATHLGAWISALVNVRAEELQGHADAGAAHRQDVHRKLDDLRATVIDVAAVANATHTHVTGKRTVRTWDAEET